MTTIASYISISEAGKKNLSMISDSRISWTLGQGETEQLTSKFDFSQKIFQFEKSKDVIGYCGDSLFCLSNISRILSYLNKSDGFKNSDSVENKRNIIEDILNHSINHYPENELQQNFKVFWNTLNGVDFCSFCFSFNITNSKFECSQNDIPNDETGLVFYDGSGKKFYLSALGNLQYKNGYNFSRTYFRALMDVIDSQIDQKTGGPPQMITISQDKGTVFPSSILFDGHYFLNGVLDIFQSTESEIEIRDTNFNFRTYDGQKRNDYDYSTSRKFSLDDWKENIKSS